MRHSQAGSSETSQPLWQRSAPHRLHSVKNICFRPRCDCPFPTAELLQPLYFASDALIMPDVRNPSHLIPENLTSTKPRPVEAPTRSYWLSTNASPPDTTTQLPRTSDVCIVGGGITGCSIAYYLSQTSPGLRVTVLEARSLSGGATGRNGGQLWPHLNDTYTAIAAKFGPDMPQKLLDFDYRTIDEMEKFVKATGSDEVFMHFFKDGAFKVFTTQEEYEVEKSDMEAMHAAGVGLDLEFLEQDATSRRLGTSTNFLGAVRFPRAGRVHPARFVHAVARAAAANSPNVVFCPYTSVEFVQRPSTPGHNFVVHTSRGVITCSSVVHCTNAYASTLLPEVSGFIVPVRNQVFATEPIAANKRPFDCLIGANYGFDYFGPREDGRIVFGGGRFNAVGMELGVADDSSLNENVSRHLHGFLPKHWAALQDVKVDMEWSGIMGFSRDRLPLVGEVPGAAGQFICAGFTGHGMTRAFLCAKAAALMVAGKSVGTWFPDIFRPHEWRMMDVPAASKVSPSKTKDVPFIMSHL